MDKMSRFMRLAELGAQLGLSKEEAHVLMKKEKLPFVQFHPRGRVFLLREDIDRWLEANTHHPKGGDIKDESKGTD